MSDDNTEKHEDDVRKHEIDVGDQFKYYRRDDVAFHPILYTWQIRAAGTNERMCIDDADVNIVLVNLTLPKYDLGYVEFAYPARMYGYPEIYKPAPLPWADIAYSYTHRLFDQEANVWIRCNYEDNSGL